MVLLRGLIGCMIPALCAYWLEACNTGIAGEGPTVDASSDVFSADVSMAEENAPSIDATFDSSGDALMSDSTLQESGDAMGSESDADSGADAFGGSDATIGTDASEDSPPACNEINCGGACCGDICVDRTCAGCNVGTAFCPYDPTNTDSNGFCANDC